MIPRTLLCCFATNAYALHQFRPVTFNCRHMSTNIYIRMRAFNCFTATNHRLYTCLYAYVNVTKSYEKYF